MNFPFQVQQVSEELVLRYLGRHASVAPVVTLEPRRRKFHRPITVSIPLPKTTRETMSRHPGTDAPSTLRLLCSLTGMLIETTLNQYVN